MSASPQDLASLRATVGAIPSPFAARASDRCRIADSSDPDVEINFTTGFPASFEQPLASGGRVVTRQMLNTLGNLGSQLQFFEQCGGYHTFDPAFAAAIGGYPQDAILQFFDEQTGALRTVRSLKDNNTDDFLADRSFIGSLVYSWSAGQRVSWSYADDNPSVGMKVDYSDFIDLSDVLFIETGVPDLYEVPYDSFLQVFAVASLSCYSMMRDESEDMKWTVGYEGEVGDLDRTPVTADINGTYFTNAQGVAYLDVCHRDSSAFGSIVMGGYRPFRWIVSKPSNSALFREGVQHFEKICPLSPLSCGILLSKGDRIRVRNAVVDSVGSELNARKPITKAIHDHVYTDKTIRRQYSVRSASLFRRGATP